MQDYGFPRMSDRSQEYRRQAAPSSLSELEQLAAVGREAHHSHQDTATARDQMERTQRAMKTVSPWWAVLFIPNSDNIAILAMPLLLVGALVSAACVAVLNALVPLVADPVSVGTSMALWLILTVLFGFTMLMIGLRHSARVRATSLQRELAWVDGLPFPLHSHLLWLAGTSDAQTILALDFRSVPDNALVTDAIRAVVPDAKVKWSDSRKAQVQIRHLDTGPDVRQFHLLTERVLLPVHRQYGIHKARWLEAFEFPTDDLAKVRDIVEEHIETEGPT